MYRSINLIFPDISKIIGFNPKNKKKPFYLKRGFYFAVTTADAVRNVYHIKKNFESDGTTIKSRIAQFIFGCPHSPEAVVGSIVHDFFTENRGLIDRRTASIVMLKLHLRYGVFKLKAYIMFMLVELFQKYVRKWK